MVVLVPHQATTAAALSQLLSHRIYVLSEDMGVRNGRAEKEFRSNRLTKEEMGKVKFYVGFCTPTRSVTEME